MNKKVIRKLVIDIEELNEDIILENKSVWLKKLGYQLEISSNYYDMPIQER